MQSLTPDMFVMLDAIARYGSFARAAQALDKAPSSVTYSVRKLEDDLDVLLFDRRGPHATLTAAGRALLEDGRHVLAELEDIARRVRRIATGWETELRIALSPGVDPAPIWDLVADFQALATQTRLRFTEEVLSGNWDALLAGRADLLIGADALHAPAGGFNSRPIGAVDFVLCMAPSHPLAQRTGVLAAADLLACHAIVVSDTSRRLEPQDRGYNARQPLLIVPNMHSKIDALTHGLGVSHLPLCMARPWLDQGLLVTRQTDTGIPIREQAVYAWQEPAKGEGLKWWLQRLESPRLHAMLTGGERTGQAGE
ncbi:LysR family transcriptional regulator [Candidimonas humi]|jgi:DNA-binding transcriptional LysR family regulator|uniref:LysR family transcriptional regulator n=1 Tax=Candidimonas humi TaxID=683355 RepID=A0ABV8NW08_9BURK|nr:LysR family transcriptional regulator [Candidimonas humi]MBV6303454.1 LysR family transcriptional regulator [Candidimonas humi]